MGLIMKTTPIVEWRRPEKIAECHLLDEGFILHMPFFGVSATVDFYSGTPDFPPTPKSAEKWRVGFIQNAIKQSLEITWEEGNTETTRSLAITKPMLDASPGPQLPFYSKATVFKGGTKDQEVHIHYWTIMYGGAKGSDIFTPPPLEPSPYGGNMASYTVELIDTPFMFIRSFRNGNRDKPLLEVKRTLTLQFWIAAVSLSVDLKDRSKYFILAQSNQFTLSSIFRRRQNHDLTCAMDAFDTGLDTKVDPNIAFNNVVGPKQAQVPRPIVSGDLSNKPLSDFIKNLGFGPKP